MEKCFYNGKEIYATDVNKDFAYENQVRQAGTSGGLKCGCEGCHLKIIYKHGEKRSPHFAHEKSDERCLYSEYFRSTKKRRPEVQRIINKWYSVIKERYPNYQIKINEKISKHWADISVHKKDEVIAIEFIDGYKNPNYISEMLKQYSEANIRTIFISIDVLRGKKFEYELGYAKRAQLNSGNRILVLFNEDNDTVSLRKHDPSQYVDFSENNLFSFDSNIVSLDLIDNPNYHPDFENQFNAFIAQRELKYGEINSKRVSLIEPAVISRPAPKEPNFKKINCEELSLSALENKFLSQLNESQLTPVLDTEGALLVTAGAGSGKTRLLTHRIAHLIRDKGVLPYHILAITFTNKAANEMKERVGRMLPDAGSGVWISTFHSMCVKMLRRYGDKVGYAPNFSIYGEIEKERLVKKLLKEKSPENEDSLKDVLWAISDAKNKNQSPDEYFDAHAYRRDAELVRDIYAAYEAELKRSNALDFDDLLTKTYWLLASSQEAREHYQNKFRYIHVDEFQDTNTIQYKLVRILAGKHGNVMAVGDEDQSIYGWRGAEIQNLRDFIGDFGCKLYKLEQNYRSTKRILGLANRIIAHNENRIEKTLWTENSDGAEVELYIADSEAGEAEYAAQKILRLMRVENRRFSDFAVLLRLNALTRAFEEKFIQYGIPYKVTGGFKFYERKEIKDILAYLRLTANPSDTEAILRVINFPRRGIGDAAVKQLVNYCLVEGRGIYDVIASIARNTDLPKNLCKKIEPFAAVLNCLSAAAKTAPVDELTKYLVRLLDLKAVYEEDTEENENRKLNIKELVNSMEQYVKLNKGAGIDEYLQNVSLYSDTDEMDLEAGCAHIATVHSAKGLEFPCVFAVALEDGIFPVSRSHDSKDDIEEERRLMYVAVTRAKERLNLSYASTRFLYGKRDYTIPSRFLSEMGYEKPKPKRVEEYAARRYGTAENDDFTINTSTTSVITPLKVQILRNDSIPVSKFRPGTRVNHRKFGAGVIASVSGTPDNCYAEIDFEAVGRLNLSLNYAPLNLADSE